MGEISHLIRIRVVKLEVINLTFPLSFAARAWYVMFALPVRLTYTITVQKTDRNKEVSMENPFC